MSSLLLPCGITTDLDPADLEWAQHFRWYFNWETGYIFRTVSIKNVQHSIYLHRMVMEPCDPFIVDHIDGNGRNNRTNNLRLCTFQENAWHRRALGGKSQYKGVTQDNRRWLAACAGIRLGSFLDELSAAQAYNEKAKELFGSFAWLNPV